MHSYEKEDRTPNLCPVRTIPSKYRALTYVTEAILHSVVAPFRCGGLRHPVVLEQYDELIAMTMYSWLVC